MMSAGNEAVIAATLPACLHASCLAWRRDFLVAVLSRRMVDIIKSKNDKKLYRHLVLESGLSVFLISDPEIKADAAAKEQQAAGKRKRAVRTPNFGLGSCACCRPMLRVPPLAFDPAALGAPAL